MLVSACDENRMVQRKECDDLILQCVKKLVLFEVNARRASTRLWSWRL